MALGGPERPEVELYRTTVEPGTMVLMAQSDWLNAVRPESLAAVAAAESPRLAQDYLSQLAAAADLSALVIGFSTPIPAVKDEAYPGAVPPLAAAPATEAATTTPAKPVAAVAAGAASQASQAAAKPAAAPPASATRPPERSRPPDLEPTGAVAATAAAAEPEERGRRSPWGLVLALVVIPLVVIGLVVAMLWFRTQNAEAQFEQTLAGAETAVTEAQGLTDEAQARLRLSSAY